MWLHWERTHKPTPGFLSISLHAPFPFANFALYLFPVINHTHEDDYMLIALSPPSKSPNLGVVLGTPNTAWLSLLDKKSQPIHSFHLSSESSSTNSHVRITCYMTIMTQHPKSWKINEKFQILISNDNPHSETALCFIAKRACVGSSSLTTHTIITVINIILRRNLRETKIHFAFHFNECNVISLYISSFNVISLSISSWKTHKSLYLINIDIHFSRGTSK